MAGIIRFLGDPHLKHERIWPGRGFSSMEEHDTAVVDSIYQTCERGDSLYLTGDICFGGAVVFEELMFAGLVRHMARKGVKHKIDPNTRPDFSIKVSQGNHDKTLMLIQLMESGWITKFSALFEFYDKVLEKKIVVSHVPMFLDRWDYNVHGHLHRTLHNQSTKHLNSSWEQFNRPVTLTELGAEPK